MTKEPEIVINGKTLSHGQAMTMRVAFESFVSDLTENGLGSDESGKAITLGYLECAKQIRHFMYLANV